MELSLRGHRLGSLPEKYLSKADVISELNLSTNELTSIGRISKLTNTERLNISFNKINNISSSPNSLKN